MQRIEEIEGDWAQLSASREHQRKPALPRRCLFSAASRLGIDLAHAQAAPVTINVFGTA